MSGAFVNWTPELRAKRSAMMRAKWADPAYRESQSKVLAEKNRTPAQIAVAVRNIMAWQERRRTDAVADAHWRAAIWSANGRPQKRAAMSEHMRAIQARPEMKAHIKTLARKTRHTRLNNSHNRKIRGGAVPDYLEGSYRALIRKGLSARMAYLAIKPFFRKG
jgi:hypothetical protein